jgi:hypothetical protein
MANRNVLLAIALIIALPVIVASLGTSGGAGIAIGVVLVLIGVVWWVAENRR